MSDTKSDIEDVTPSRTNDVFDIEFDSSSLTNEKYRAGGIERLLKTQTAPKQYIIIKKLITIHQVGGMEYIWVSWQVTSKW